MRNAQARLLRIARRRRASAQVRVPTPDILTFDAAFTREHYRRYDALSPQQMMELLGSPGPSSGLRPPSPRQRGEGEHGRDR